jgi:hypothetical protein
VKKKSFVIHLNLHRLPVGDPAFQLIQPSWSKVGCS